MPPAWAPLVPPLWSGKAGWAASPAADEEAARAAEPRVFVTVVAAVAAKASTAKSTTAAEKAVEAAGKKVCGRLA